MEAAAHLELPTSGSGGVGRNWDFSGGDHGYVCGCHYQRRVCRRNQGARYFESSIASLKQSLRRDEQVVASAVGYFADLVLLGPCDPVLLGPEICLELF